MPCPICNDFKGGREKRERGKSVGLGTRNHKKTGLHWDQFANSATCFICDVLARGIRGCLQQHNIDESDVSSLDLFFYYEECVGDVADTNKELRIHLRDGRRFDIELFATEGDDCPIPSDWETFPTYHRTSPGTDSDAALATIEDWLKGCLGPSDEFCTAPIEAELPARVVDVGAGDAAMMRLVETHGTVARYICLSHCWGKEQIITTTRSTLKERLVEIKTGELPKTFRDAIALTRRLGVRYIWIDSLCIVQDDLRDWEVESAKMCDIYSRAYLTIAATHAKDGRGGLFRETPDFEVSGVAPANIAEYRVFFRERIDHHLDDSGAVGKVGYPTIAHYPILTRAWVYQERMLSTRVLHFGRYEIFFECRSDVRCECGGIGWHGCSAAAPAPVTKVVHADALDSEMPGGGAEWVDVARYYIARLWRTMVSSYTSLSITKSGDRLPAMGGLARHMAARRKSAYLAGLWEDALMDDLLWYCDGSSSSKKPRPVPRTAPTWSWASIDRYVLYTDEILLWDSEGPSWDYEREPYQHYARVEKCTVIPGGVDEFGTVSQGRLQVCGLAATGILQRGIETRMGRDSATYHVLFPNGVRLPVKADYLLDEAGGDQVLPGTEVKCLRMSWLQSGSWDIFMSLVLRPVSIPGASSIMYERIGCIRIDTKAGGGSGPSPAVDPAETVYCSVVEQAVVII
ncbi:heterokaryon incompatibility protein-domain-containing protein [Cercophora newfieldiana]|uniref:Heterokaryon incompatibility protein-domain-containing protein n=1 Tax=Cercophora newfieldiana TaxID=92897 RepID=A0AA39YTY5_9PEZI|nr:heterokaryon incompatibility protein-domain-containing protein [Cercophora newfieldiana]